MKKILVLLLAAIMCLSFAACGGNEPEETDAPETPIQSEEEIQEEPVEEKPNYAEIIPGEIQGVWCDSSIEGLLSLYAFEGNNIETYVVNIGEGAAEFFYGTYTVGDGELKYNFSGGTASSNFTYDNNVLVLTNATGTEFKKLSAADLMAYLTQEENSANDKGVICLAEIIANNYPDSSESNIAIEKKDAAEANIKAIGEKALSRLKTDYDKVQKLTWYEHENQPKYIDTRCFIYPYIGRTDDGITWLRVKVNYTDAKTDAGWIFFERIIFSVDGENTTKSFSYYDIIRDNDTEVWETADFEPSTTEVDLLRSIANSSETIIRFQGDEYHYDHKVTQKEKDAIIDVLTAYDYLINYY